MSAARPMDVRRAGVLLHVTSLPGGDLGPEAYRFVDFLADAGVTVWQVLPLVPTHEEDRSPYNALSAMAGNPELISRARQVEEGLVDEAGLSSAQRVGVRRLVRGAGAPGWTPTSSSWRCATCRTTRSGRRGSRAAGPRSRLGSPRCSRRTRARSRRCASSSGSSPSSGASSRSTPRRGACSSSATCRSSSRTTAPTSGRPGSSSSSTREGQPITVTGVPPDYFAADGQRWNNPHYDWDRMAARRVRLVATADRPPGRAVRPRADRPLPRLRGGLARAGRGRDREGRLLGAQPGPRGPRRARRRQPAPGRWSRRTSG